MFLILLILNGTAKMKLAVLVFLYCEEIVKNWKTVLWRKMYSRFVRLVFPTIYVILEIFPMTSRSFN